VTFPVLYKNRIPFTSKNWNRLSTVYTICMCVNRSDQFQLSFVCLIKAIKKQTANNFHFITLYVNKNNGSYHLCFTIYNCIENFVTLLVIYIYTCFLHGPHKHEHTMSLQSCMFEPMLGTSTKVVKQI
jgi:hypothetical protein